MDKATVLKLDEILTKAKTKIANLVGDMSGMAWAIRVHVYYGAGFGKKKVDYDSDQNVKSPNRVIKINGIDHLQRWLKNFKAAGFNYAEFQDVVYEGKKKELTVHEDSKEIAKACDKLLNDYFDVIMKRVPSVVEDSTSTKEVKAENADLRKQLAELTQRMDAADSVTSAAKSAKAELEEKTGEESTGDSGDGDEVKTLLESGTKAQLIAHILKNVTQDETESQLKKLKADDLKAIIVSAE